MNIKTITSRMFYVSIAFYSFTISALSAEPPNIVLIMADDMGYSDIGAYGGEINTPHIDSLAEQGLRFTNFYNNAKCGPSRISLLTGLYPHRGSFAKGATIADVLKPRGYRTIMAGKWHQKGMPVDHGFDRYTGLLDGCCNFWNPGIDAKLGEPIPGRKPTNVRTNRSRVWGIEGERFTNYVPKEKDFYTTDVFTKYAVDRLEEYKNEDRPFFLYVAYTAPHYPLHAWPEDIQKYKDTYQVGWDVIRKRRYKKLLKLGLIPEGTKLPESYHGVRAWDSLTKEEQTKEAYKMAVYAAMIDRMDQGIGKILEKLKELGKHENTLVMFLSDNGNTLETVDLDTNIPPGPVEGYRALGSSWANASNSPYRKYKGTTHEAGIKTPFIASWPQVIKPGGITPNVAHLIDILPTFLDVADAEYPTEIRDHVVLPYAGKSLLPALKNKELLDKRPIFWSYIQARGLRLGDWKIVSASVKKDKDYSEWELYNLATDPTETNNLAVDHPEKIKVMSKMWDDWKSQKQQN